MILLPKDMTAACKECGCACSACFNDNSLDLHQQIEELHSELRRSNAHVTHIKLELMQSKQAAESEVYKLRDELLKLRDRYDRLLESHKRLQKVNHSLEDKLLKIVNKYEGEKMLLQKEMAAITSKLVDAKVSICNLEAENERYRNDCNVAVQLLQCKPSAFVAQRLTSLPIDLQDRVKSHMSQEQIIHMEKCAQKLETRLIRVPMQTFPPTAMVYSVNNSNDSSEDELNGKKDAISSTVPMSLIAKVLQPDEPNSKLHRVYICHKCQHDLVLVERETQTCGVVRMIVDRSGHTKHYSITGMTGSGHNTGVSNGTNRMRNNSVDSYEDLEPNRSRHSSLVDMDSDERSVHNSYETDI